MPLPSCNTPAVTAGNIKVVVSTAMIEIVVECTRRRRTLSPIKLSSLLLNVLTARLPTLWPALHIGGLSWENVSSPSYTKRYVPLRMTKVQYRLHKSSQMDPSLNLLNQQHAPIAKISELPQQRKILSWIIRTKTAYAFLIFSAKYVKTISHSFT